MRHTIPYLILLAIGVTGISCNKAEPSDTKCEEITVSLKLNGDFDAVVDQEPMSKASTSSDDAYGINVYYDKESNGATDDLYAYGLFDNTSDMSITLLSGHKYKVCCTLVKDAKKTLFYGQAFGNKYSGYAYPFQTNVSNSTQLENRFIIGTSTYFTGLQLGKVHLSTASPDSGDYTEYASINRFYGETDQYEPIPNGVIDVYLKRVIFGAKFVITGLQEGTLDVKCGNIFSEYFNVYSDHSERIFSFNNIYDTWKNETPLNETVSITYNSDRGKLWNITQKQSVLFKRNVMTTVNIKVCPDLSGANITFTEEEMNQENNIDLGINTNGLIDIIVNPKD